MIFMFIMRRIVDMSISITVIIDGNFDRKLWFGTLVTMVFTMVFTDKFKGLSMAFLQHIPWSRNSRPDITHQCLMALLDSPLNKAFVAGCYPL